MLHSKVYVLEMGDGTAAALVGSHNLTGFALLRLNGEAGILREGPADGQEFAALRRHVDESVTQAVPYDPSMKEAYSWWPFERWGFLHHAMVGPRARS
jgi:HKD family nuclease